MLEVRTATPDAVLLSRLAAPQLMILAPKAYRRDPTSPDPVGTGTGPCRLVAVGAAGATLDRYDRYWGGRPALGGLDVRFLPDGAARVGALYSGEMHVINQIPVAQLPNLRDRHLLDIPLPARSACI